jgi:cytochrome P450
VDVLRPLPIYRILRRERPVAPIVMSGGVSAYLVTRYADVRAVLEDARFSRVALSKTRPDELVAYAPPSAPVAPDEADHSMPYGLVNRWFTPRAVERLRPRTTRIAEELVDRVSHRTPPVDLVAELTTALPMTVIGELAGIPERDRRWLRDLAPLVTVDVPDARSKQASAAVFAYFGKALDARRAAPTDDLLSHLVSAAQKNPGKVTRDKLVTLAMRTCLPAFHSVSVALSKGIPILLRQPEVYAAVGRDSGQAPVVVEELLRLATPAPAALPRLTLCDVELAGVPIPAGRVVVGSLESANTDEERYPDPDRIDLARGAVEHTTFGRGPNFCFGAALSRMELQVVMATLAQRLPGLRLTVTEGQLPVRTGAIAPDVLSLPVRW